jgi:peptidoglycan/LPS O-acetylase OafA/YrhL
MPSAAVANVVQERRSSKTTFRGDIQGLRAIAVVLVVLDHAFHWPLGGFVGVDVFYVISGFLITGLLLRELDRTGSVSLRGFYARRMRRILPAAVTVLAVVVVAAFALWFLPRAVQTLLDAISALLFVSNWHFIATGADYLQAAGAVSPVQHYWSLSIEEQFYAVWPLGLLLLFWMFKGSRRALIVIVIVGIVASLAWAAYRTGTNAEAAYFDTFARVWELLAGALLAIVGTASSRVPVLTRRIVAVVGLAMIVVGAIIVTPDWAVPFPWVAPAVIGAVLVIWASAPATRGSLLGNPVSQWLGDVSYSLYLWHFPVLIFAASLFGDSPIVAAICIPIMLGLSELSRRFIEQPVMRSRFLRTAAKATNSRPFVARDVLLGVAVFAAIAVLSVAQLRGPIYLTNGAAAQSFITDDGAQPAAAGFTSDANVQSAIAEAARVDSWPDLTPSIDELSESQAAPAMSQTDGCRNDVKRSDPLICVTNPDQPQTALVIGDSVAISWIPTVEAALPGWTVVGLGYANCPVVSVTVGDRAFAEQCQAARDRMVEEAKDLQPDLIITSSAQSSLSRLADAPADAVQVWADATGKTVTDLGAIADVVVLGSPPAGVDPQSCATRLTSPQRCTSTISEQWKARTASEAKATTAAGGRYVDVSKWFCDQTGSCPMFIDGTVTRFDGAHLTEAYATRLGPVLADRL